ncbi:MAG: uroporphyrinogen-III C-methyltransferase [Planctomycetaceae bacterium]|nr:uroporphyrinogen-III C-methyltransferase [Planctomycetaceae bacterium]
MPDTCPVILVGAGPGDPGLLTVAGRQAIENAEVVLYDRLVGDDILALIPRAAERIDVGKRKGDHPVPQDRINRLILEHARSGKRVVRLKGGDPFLFGRGGEELDLLVENGVPFRIVSGVTSAIAAPASVGIPVTHRDHASSVHIITGHGKDGAAPDIPFAALAGLRGTLVFLMGLSSINHIADGLVAAGLDADTPAALVENGTLPWRRRLDGTLGTIGAVAQAEKATAPAILVVGDVCRLAGQYDRTGTAPLRHRNILVVSSETTASRLAARLIDLGARVRPVAAIAMAQRPIPDEPFNLLRRFNWVVLTSRFASRLFLDELRRRRIDVRSLAGIRFAVVGTATGKPLVDMGIFPDLIADDPSASALAAALRDRVRKDDRVLLFRAAIGDRSIDETLTQRGIDFVAVDAYDTTHRDDQWDGVAQNLAAGVFDAVTFTSASAVAAFADAVPVADMPDGAFQTFCIGAMTAEAATAVGLQPLIPPSATIDAMALLIRERLENA